MTSFRTPTQYLFFKENNYFWPYINESAEIAEISPIFFGKKLSAIFFPVMSCQENFIRLFHSHFESDRRQSKRNMVDIK